MTDRPMLFSGPMVRALLAGTKTQTRRVLAFQDWQEAIVKRWPNQKACVPVQTGDRLWVRESWWHHKSPHIEQAGFVGGTITLLDDGPARFHANDQFDPALHVDVWRKRPSIHMPRWASRLTLIVTDVRVERLQDISKEDARAEGVEEGERTFDYDIGEVRQAWFSVPGFDDPGTGISAVDMYAQLWNTINGPGCWEANPWVMAVSFTVQHGNIDSLPKVAA